MNLYKHTSATHIFLPNKKGNPEDAFFDFDSCRSSQFAYRHDRCQLRHRPRQLDLGPTANEKGGCDFIATSTSHLSGHKVAGSMRPVIQCQASGRNFMYAMAFR